MGAMTTKANSSAWPVMPRHAVQKRRLRLPLARIVCSNIRFLLSSGHGFPVAPGILSPAARLPALPAGIKIAGATRIDTARAGKFRHDGMVHLPQAIQEAIEECVEAAGFAAVKRAAAILSDAYRDGRVPLALPAPERVAAYLVTRMPATYAANCRALSEAAHLLGERAISSVLDVGAGSGAAALAAREHFPAAELTLIERDAALAEAARPWLPEAVFRVQDAARIETFPPHDLVIASYSLGEMGPHTGPRVVRRLWQAARVALVILEPGTPKGFAFLREIRTSLLAAGAHMLAPCPAAAACPMADPDWCHFAARVERSSMHRRIKEGALGYEDEKFSYIAFAREPVILPAARIIRRPRHHASLIEIETCTPTGLRPERISRRDRDAFRAARKADWGDAWEA